MQCATCQKEFDPKTIADPTSCPACGAPLAAKRGGGPWTTILLSFLFVALATFAAGSTMVAINTMAERDSWREDATNATRAIDQMVLAATNNGKLKGPANRKARQEILGPAVGYYQTAIYKRQDNVETWPQVASMQFNLAGLEASLGSASCAETLTNGFGTLRSMREANVAPESFPSLNATALRIAAPMEWAMVDAPLALHAPALLISIQTADTEFRDLADLYPSEPSFRDDRSAVLRTSAILQTAAPGREEFAIGAWNTAAGLLETLVQEQPSNPDYQERLVEALVGSARLLRKAGKNADAIPKFKRAIEVQEQRVAADPENKTLANALSGYKKDLEKLESAAAAKPAAEGDSADPAT